MPAPTLHEAALEYAAEKAAPGSVSDRAVQRAFMAGALAALTLSETVSVNDLRRQIVDYGRTVGTALETAR